MYLIRIVSKFLNKLIGFSICVSSKQRDLRLCSAINFINVGKNSSMSIWSKINANRL